MGRIQGKDVGSLCLKLLEEDSEDAVGMLELLRRCGKQSPRQSTCSWLLCCGTFLKIHASGSVAPLWLGDLIWLIFHGIKFAFLTFKLQSTFIFTLTYNLEVMGVFPVPPL